MANGDPTGAGGGDDTGGNRSVLNNGVKVLSLIATAIQTSITSLVAGAASLASLVTDFGAANTTLSDIETQLTDVNTKLDDINTTLAASFPQVTGTAGSATAGAATLPANPVGFITVLLPGGSTVLVPYYDP